MRAVEKNHGSFNSTLTLLALLKLTGPRAKDGSSLLPTLQEVVAAGPPEHPWQDDFVQLSQGYNLPPAYRACLLPMARSYAQAREDVLQGADSTKRDSGSALASLPCPSALTCMLCASCVVLQTLAMKKQAVLCGLMLLLPSVHTASLPKDSHGFQVACMT